MRQRRAGLDGDAVDRGNGDLVEIAHCGVERLRDRAQTVVGAEGIVVTGRDGGYERRAARISTLGILWF